jgi:short-subunit dehydrogenase
MKKAIVIGASSGIGREMVKLLATDNYLVGAMARRMNLLEELNSELNGAVLIQNIDVTETETAIETLKNFVKKMENVDLVVVCAGTGELNNNLDWCHEKETIETNVAGFTAVVNVAMHHFIEKGKGHLVAISSISALRGGRVSPAYNASKAFESNYLEGLRQKVTNKKLPITITDIKLGLVDTAMAKGEGLFWVAPPEKAAKQIYQAIKRKKANAYVTRRWMLIAWILKILPRFIYEKL